MEQRRIVIFLSKFQLKVFLNSTEQFACLSDKYLINFKHEIDKVKSYIRSDLKEILLALSLHSYNIHII